MACPWAPTSATRPSADLSDASYSDYNVSVSKDIAKVGTVGLLLTGTDAKDDCAAGEAYCFAGYSAGKNTAVLSFSKSF